MSISNYLTLTSITERKYLNRYAKRKGSSSKVPFNKEVNGHSSCVTVKSPYESKLKRGFEELP